MGGSGAIAGLVKNASHSPEAPYTYRADMRTFPFKTATNEFSGLSCPFEGPASLDPTFTPDFPMDGPYTPHIAEGTNCVAELEGQFYLGNL